SVVTSVSTVGSKKVPPCAARLPPVTTLAPFFRASAMCASTFSTAFMSMSGPITAPGSNPSPTFIEPAVSASLLLPASYTPSCITIRLAQTQVGSALRYFEAIAPLAPEGQALDRHLDIGVVKDGKRRVAAQFERDLLDSAGALLHQQFADLGSSRLKSACRR